jgi:hypothetical protein
MARTITRTWRIADLIFRAATQCTMFTPDGTPVTYDNGTPIRYGINFAWARWNAEPRSRLRDHGDGKYTVDGPEWRFEFEVDRDRLAEMVERWG